MRPPPIAPLIRKTLSRALPTQRSATWQPQASRALRAPAQWGIAASATSPN